MLYSFQPPSNFFAIDSGRGIVSVIRELDYEVTQAYQLQVNATVSLILAAEGVFLEGLRWGRSCCLFILLPYSGICAGTSSVFHVGIRALRCLGGFKSPL